MITNKNICFCAKCRKNTEYKLVKRSVERRIRDKDYSFSITTAVCRECGEEMSIQNLFDWNAKEMDEQYRKAENIVSVSDIEKLMNLYKLGKAPLSLVLGFGEITITRYLLGQVPSKEYSDIIKLALTSPKFMLKKLDENKDKISSTAYNKAVGSANELIKLFSVSDKMQMVISALFNELEEITPLMLQKLLYYVQGLTLTLTGKPIFTEECEAWVHGPVYRKVYELFSSFKFNPIDDDKFALISDLKSTLTEEEKTTVKLVADTFGVYSAKTLEKLSHKEKPWLNARKGYADEMHCEECISKDSIKAYFDDVNKTFDLHSELGIKRYINSILLN